MAYDPQALAHGREAVPNMANAPGARAAAKRKGARASTRRKDGAAAPRGSLYDEVTARIVAELEAGRVPWVQPWDAASFVPGLPLNAASGRSYSGINILILWSEATARGFGAQRWLTFRQAQEAGGTVRKGEKGTTVFYAARFTPRGDDAPGGGGMEASAQRGNGHGNGNSNGNPNGNASGGDGGSEAGGGIPFLKRFTVFNVDQCEGLPPRCLAAAAPLGPSETIPAAEALIAATGADVRIGGGEAYYSPAEDFVALPPPGAFLAPLDYYSTALHELGHWTGHPSRLGRDQKGDSASPSYAREELCAELASAFLCAALGIVPTVRHADYIGAWLAIMRADTRAIFKAASLASKAADYLLAFAPAPVPGSARGADAAGAGQ